MHCSLWRKHFSVIQKKKNAKKTKYINKNKILPESSPRNPLIIIKFTPYAAHLELVYGVRMEVLVRCVLPPRGELQKQTGHLDQVFFCSFVPPPPHPPLNAPLKPALSSRTARTWFSPLEVTYIQPPRALFSIPKAPRSRRHCHTSLWTNNWDAPAEERRGSEELKPLWVSLLTSRSMIALILSFLNPLLFYHCFSFFKNIFFFYDCSFSIFFFQKRWYFFKKKK